MTSGLSTQTIDLILYSGWKDHFCISVFLSKLSNDSTFLMSVMVAY